MDIDRTDWLEADRLNEQGRVCADAGDWDAALSFYRQAVDRVPVFEPAWFSMALVYKQRRQRDQAMDCNARAAALGGEEGDPSWWAQRLSVVLHDGAPNGERRARGRVYGVFDQLDRWQPSAIPTLLVQVTLAEAAARRPRAPGTALGG